MRTTNQSAFSTSVAFFPIVLQLEKFDSFALNTTALIPRTDRRQQYLAWTKQVIVSCFVFKDGYMFSKLRLDILLAGN